MESQNLNNLGSKEDKINFGTDELNNIISGDELFESSKEIDGLISSEPEVSGSGDEKLEQPISGQHEDRPENNLSSEQIENINKNMSGEESKKTDEMIVEDKETEKMVEQKIKEEIEKYGASTVETSEEIPTSFFEESEEGPINLSQDELSNILEDVEEKPSTEPISEESIPTGVDLESGEIKTPGITEEESVLEGIEEPGQVLEIPEEKTADELETLGEVSEEEISSSPLYQEESAEIGGKEGKVTEPSAKEIEELPSEEATQKTAKESFFEEVEDESISLSGDELDNILKTAEVVEAPSEEPPKSALPEQEIEQPEISVTPKEESTPSVEQPTEVTEPISEIPSPLESEGLPPIEEETISEPITPSEAEMPPQLSEEISEIPSPLEVETQLPSEEKKIGAVSEQQSIEEKKEVLQDEDLKKLMKYLDTLLEKLPDDVIKEFAESEYYDLYNKILDKLGI